MNQRNHKFIMCILLSVFWIGVSGCTDNPDAKAAKQMRRQTTQAVQTSVTEKDYDAAQQKVAASLQQNRAKGLTKDAALLASGNLALVKGRQMQADVDPKVLQLRISTNKLEKVLRDAEFSLLEKERIKMLLAAQEKELTELQKLLTGDDQAMGLNQQLETVDVQLTDLLSQKASLQSEREQIQAILDEHQSNADALMRQAELAKGETRLSLEKQAFALLEQRKDLYVNAQALENKIGVVEAESQLVQLRYDGLSQNIQEVQQRIEAISSSQAQTALSQQMREIEAALSENQQRLSAASAEISNAFTAYRKSCQDIYTVYEEALAEFEKIRTSDANFAATVRLADAAYHIASARSAYINTQKDLQERLQGFLDSTDPTFLSAIQSKLPMQQDPAAKKEALGYFDRSIETYQEAASLAGRLGSEAKCSVLKAQLLAMYGKMQLADLTEEFNVADVTESAMNELIEQGRELGTCFTQSETMRVIANRGLNYLPSLPLNMEVFLDEKKRELSQWKALPPSEQESAVDSNVQQIDKLIAQYGQDVADQLEPLKQEMLDAKERGFKEISSTDTEEADTYDNYSPGMPGEPNAMF